MWCPLRGGWSVLAGSSPLRHAHYTDEETDALKYTSAAEALSWGGRACLSCSDLCSSAAGLVSCSEGPLQRDAASLVLPRLV